MTREKTARLIPNAIQVCTSTEKVKCVRREQSLFYIKLTHNQLLYISLYLHLQFFFTSFSAREKSYQGVFRMWQNTLLDKVWPSSTYCICCYSLLIQTHQYNVQTPCGGSNSCSCRSNSSPGFIPSHLYHKHCQHTDTLVQLLSSCD